MVNLDLTTSEIQWLQLNLNRNDPIARALLYKLRSLKDEPINNGRKKCIKCQKVLSLRKVKSKAIYCSKGCEIKYSIAPLKSNWSERKQIN